jgi:hypothetical protein
MTSPHAPSTRGYLSPREDIYSDNDISIQFIRWFCVASRAAFSASWLSARFRTSPVKNSIACSSSASRIICVHILIAIFWLSVRISWSMDGESTKGFKEIPNQRPQDHQTTGRGHTTRHPGPNPVAVFPAQPPRYRAPLGLSRFGIQKFQGLSSKMSKAGARVGSGPGLSASRGHPFRRDATRPDWCCTRHQSGSPRR